MKNKQSYEKDKSNENRLFDYLHDKMSNKERHAFEMETNEDPFLLDAMEGLMKLNEPNKANQIHGELLQFIKVKTSKRKIKKTNPIQFPTWLILLIATVFLMAVAGVVLIKWLHK